MRIVAALGGNALLRRGEPADALIQLGHVAAAATALAPLATRHQLVVTHGNGPQVGLLATESADDASLARPYPFDALDAQTQGMIGYWLAQALGNALPGREVACLLTQTLVSPGDPAFDTPTKFVGRGYGPDEVEELRRRGWAVARDGSDWRRVVASPEPVGIVETPTIGRLVAAGCLVICAGGGGVPVVDDGPGARRGVEAVVDKDLTAAVLAESLHADLLLLLTDVAAVQRDFGRPTAQPVGRTTPGALRMLALPPGSMGPKVEAACRFVERTGHRAAIGALDDAARVADGLAGTSVHSADVAA